MKHIYLCCLALVMGFSASGQDIPNLQSRFSFGYDVNAPHPNSAYTRSITTGSSTIGQGIASAPHQGLTIAPNNPELSMAIGQITSEFTVSVWYKSDGSAANHTYEFLFDMRRSLGAGGGFFARLNRRDNVIEFGSNPNWMRFPLNVAQHAGWNHFVFIYNENARLRTVYVNDQRLNHNDPGFVSEAIRLIGEEVRGRVLAKA